MKFQEQILEWYKNNHRKLPWRETKDPYKIWISEIMLQQTQVNTVIDYYNRFIQVFPNVYALAQAKEDDILKLWEGLGYYTRARKMMLCAREIVEKHEGVFPEDYEKVLKLPGIGPYTAGAVLSIAYNKPLPAVDGNVMRVLSRQFNIQEDTSKPQTRKIFEEKVKKLLPKDCCHFNQSLMELGATICIPKNPKCHSCPVDLFCIAKKHNLQTLLPVKTKKSKKRMQKMALAYVKYENQVLLVKRDAQGLLGGLWGFPIVEIGEKAGYESVEQELMMKFGISVEFVKLKSRAKHIFTHLVWEMILVEYKAFQKVTIDFPTITWIEEDSIDQYPLPTAFKKLL